MEKETFFSSHSRSLIGIHLLLFGLGILGPKSPGTEGRLIGEKAYRKTFGIPGGRRREGRTGTRARGADVLSIENPK